MVDAGHGLRLCVRVHRSAAATRGTGAPGAARLPILLLHGFTGTGDGWRRLTAALAGHLDVVTVDLPGHGRSTAPADSGRYAFGRLADDLAAVLDAVGAARAIVLGYSMGGRAALKLALHHPDRVAALVLESTSPGIADPAQRAARRESDHHLAHRLEREGITPFVDHWERLPLWASQSALDEWTRGELRAQRLMQSPAGLANCLRGAGQGLDPPVTDRLAELRFPVLLVAGALDAGYVALARMMAARLPDARLEIVPDAGHAVHLERPAQYADVVKRFLAQHSFIRPGDAADTAQESA